MKKQILNIINQNLSISDDEIFKHQVEETKIVNNLNTQLPYQFFDKIMRYDSGWENINMDDSWVTNYYKIWERTLLNFDLRLLPFLSFYCFLKINNGNQENDDLTIYDAPNIHHTFQIQETPLNNISTVKIISSFHFVDYNSPYQYQCKLLMQFVNPRQYK